VLKGAKRRADKPAQPVLTGGGGGIRTLDTPLRGITVDSFTVVPYRLLIPLFKPNSHMWG